MRGVVALALKDLTLLVRVKSGLFFTFVWPLLIAIGFGLILGGTADGPSAIAVAVADADGTAGSAAFVERLEGGGELAVRRTTADEAIEAVRRGSRTAAILVEPGFGAASERAFFGSPPRLRVAIDPSRRAEAGMLEGVLMKHGMIGFEKVLSDPDAGRRSVAQAMRALPPEDVRSGRMASTGRFLAEMDRFLAGGGSMTGAGGQPGWKPLEIVREDVSGDARGPRSTFEFTFPQGVVWGLLGCVMSFAIGLVVERTHGTLVRLQAAPISRAQLLAGKAVACFLATLGLQILMYGLAAVAFGVRIASVAGLAGTMVSASVAFVGIMMLVAAIGRNEQSTSAAGWALMMPLSMIGGGMIPLFLMPAWLVQVGHVSPVKWAILAYEGATWRAFGWHEMLLPCGILLAAGLLTFAAGTRLVRTH